MSRYRDSSDLTDPPEPIDSATDEEIVMRWRGILGLQDNQQLPGCANLQCVHCLPVSQRFNDSTVDWTPEQRSLFLSALALLHESEIVFPWHLRRLRYGWWHYQFVAASEPTVDLPWLPNPAAKLADRHFGWLLAEAMEYLLVSDAYLSAIISAEYGNDRKKRASVEIA